MEHREWMYGNVSGIDRICCSGLRARSSILKNHASMHYCVLGFSITVIRREIAENICRLFDVLIRSLCL